MKLHLPLDQKAAFKIFTTLVTAEILFCLIYFMDYWTGSPSWRIHDLFNLDAEATIPAWFTAIQLFLIGFMLLVTSYHQNYQKPPSKKGIFVIGLGFIYLSLDEAAEIHEKITYEFHDNPLVPYFEGTHGIWIVVYGCIGLLLLAVLFKDIQALWNHYRKESLILIIGMIIFLIGAAGAETITFFHIDKGNTLVYTIEVMLEEFFEMLGASTLFYGLLLFSIDKTK